MNRREIIKGLAALSVLTILPKEFLKRRTQVKSTHFIGIGRAGSKVLRLLHSKGIQAKYTAITENRNKELLLDMAFINFTPPYKINKYINNIGAVKVSDMNQKLIVPKEVTDLFSNDEKFILFAGLGGYTGTYMSRELAVLLNENKKDYLIICCLPFSFYGTEQKHHANRIKDELQTDPNFRYFECDKIIEQYGDMMLSDAFLKADEKFYEIYSTPLVKLIHTYN